MLPLSREYVAYLLAGYGEPEVSAAILKTSDEDFRLVQEAANRGAIEGEEWLKVACRAAIELVEGERRELRRRQLIDNDLPWELLAGEHRARAVRREALSRGAPVKKPRIFAGLATAIAPELVGYRYFKTRAQFEKAFSGGSLYVALHRGRGIVDLRFGVTHDGIQRAELALFGPRRVVANPRPYPQTVVVNSINISPRNHCWPHEIDGSWLIMGEEGIQFALTETVTIVRNVIVPFIERNQAPPCIRETLLSIRGRIASLRPARTVFAIDWLEQRRDWLDVDLAFFEERFQDYSQEKREKLRSEYRTTVDNWDSGDRRG